MEVSAARGAGALPPRGRAWSPGARTGGDADAAVRDGRRALLRALLREGVRLSGRGVVPVDGDVRSALARQWKRQHAAWRSRERDALEAWDAPLDLRLWGQPPEIDPVKVRPRFVVVSDVESADAALWRWIVLNAGWPVRRGTHRRIRVLVVDEGHGGRLIGVLGVSEASERLPLLHAWCGADVGATGSDRAWLLHVFEAVGPYRSTHGRMLLAGLATSAEFHRVIHEEAGSDVAALVVREELGRRTFVDFEVPAGPVVRLGLGADHDWRVWGECAQLLLDAARSRLRDAPERVRDEGIALGSMVGRSGLAALGLGAQHPRLIGSGAQVLVFPMTRAARSVLGGGGGREGQVAVATVTRWWARRWGGRGVVPMTLPSRATRPEEGRFAA
ncbi:Druantia anti-phage system protein DruA [Curtobacterium poinsettiae]